LTPPTCTRCDYITTKKHSAHAFAYAFTYTRNLKVPTDKQNSSRIYTNLTQLRQANNTKYTET